MTADRAVSDEISVFLTTVPLGVAFRATPGEFRMPSLDLPTAPDAERMILAMIARVESRVFTQRAAL